MSEKIVNVLITGASGFLGRIVYKYFTNSEFSSRYPLSNNAQNVNFKWNVVGLCHSRVKDNLKPLDLTNFDLVQSFIDELKPEVIIHCAAERKVEVVENDFENALKINSGATKNLADIAAKNNIFFIYISTDYVFDGTNPPYKINDKTNPLNKYGISKLYGESVTLSSSERHCIVRVPVLYGNTELNKFSESAVNVLIEKVRKGEPYLVDDVQIRFPTHIIDVSRFLMQLVLKYLQADPQNNQIKGILHCSAPDQYTKYTMSCIMADLYNLKRDHIQQDLSASQNTGVPQLRPLNSKLDTQYSFDLLNFQTIIKFEESIKDCLENFV